MNSESFSCAGKMPERRTRSAGPVQIKAPIVGKTHSNRSAHGASFSQPKAGPMSNASVVGLAKIGKAYRILLSPLIGMPHHCIPAGDAAMRRSELAYFNKQMLIHELIRGSLVNSVGLNRPQSFNLKPSWVALKPSDS
jgi:hypothetical protein